MTERLTVDQFFAGLFAAMAKKGLKRPLSIREEKFDQAVFQAYERLREKAQDAELNVRFRIHLHPTHADSLVVRDALYTAAQRNLVSLDNPEFQDVRIKLGPDEADSILSSLPGGSAFYSDLMSKFFEAYEG